MTIFDKVPELSLRTMSVRATAVIPAIPVIPVFTAFAANTARDIVKTIGKTRGRIGVDFMTFEGPVFVVADTLQIAPYVF